MKENISLPSDKEFLTSNGISISNEIEADILYTHFMSIEGSKWDFNRHSHSFYEIHIAAEDGFFLEIDDVKLYVPTEHCVIIPPGLNHRIIECGVKLLRFSLALDLNCGEDKLLIRDFTPKAYTLNEKCRFYVNNIISEQSAKKTGYREIINSSVKCLLIEIIRESKMLCAEEIRVQRNSALTKAVQFIDDNLSRKISLDEVADAAYISTRQLNRIFRTDIGTSAARYIKIKRINRVKEYLKKTNLTVGEIAYLNGFESESALCKQFKCETGISPSKYRINRK